jgi:hypothetical protein
MVCAQQTCRCRRRSAAGTVPGQLSAPGGRTVGGPAPPWFRHRQGREVGRDQGPSDGRAVASVHRGSRSRGTPRRATHPTAVVTVGRRREDMPKTRLGWGESPVVRPGRRRWAGQFGLGVHGPCGRDGDEPNEPFAPCSFVHVLQGKAGWFGLVRPSVLFKRGRTNQAYQPSLPPTHPLISTPVSTQANPLRTKRQNLPPRRRAARRREGRSTVARRQAARPREGETRCIRGSGPGPRPGSPTAGALVSKPVGARRTAPRWAGGRRPRGLDWSAGEPLTQRRRRPLPGGVRPAG